VEEEYSDPKERVVTTIHLVPAIIISGKRYKVTTPHNSDLPPGDIVAEHGSTDHKTCIPKV
jgi:hypothetical protein